MTVRRFLAVFTSTPRVQTAQRGVSGVTVAVVLAAAVALTLAIVQTATSGGASSVQAGIPGLIG